MEFLRQYIESMIEIDESDWSKVEDLFVKQEYKQGEEVFAAGEICQNFFYVSSGVLRLYSITTEGKEITIGLNHKKHGYVPEPLSGDYISYLTQEESTIFIEAIEDSIVYIAAFGDLDEIYESELKWMRFAKQISDSQLIALVKRIRAFARLTAKERYELMKKLAPIYEDVLPDYQYASVLGITPQSLSRTKKELKD